jgi:hypothetical protein
LGSYELRLFTDRLAAGAQMASLPLGVNRILYVAEGAALIAADGGSASLAPNSAWHGRGETAIRAGAQGLVLLRTELALRGAALAAAEGEGIDSRLTLAAALSLDLAQPYLLRCDRVDFPPGGVAYTHTHQGPGLRCLQSGDIRIQTQGDTHAYGPGQAWFETGHDPVYAVASATDRSHFIRVMVLPRALQGRSSIRYLLPEDQDKPKRQSYQVFIDAPIEI